MFSRLEMSKTKVLRREMIKLKDSEYHDGVRLSWGGASIMSRCGFESQYGNNRLRNFSKTLVTLDAESEADSLSRMKLDKQDKIKTLVSALT